MSRLLKWDGTEMDFVSNLTLRAMRMLFSTWTNHLAVGLSAALWLGRGSPPVKVNKWLVGGCCVRYFAHLSFQTTKWFEMMMALTIQASASNENIVYWINFHEFHHMSCETEEDPHSPHHLGFWAVQTMDSSARLVTTREGVERLFRTDLLEHRFKNNLVWLRNWQLEIKLAEHAFWLLAGPSAVFWMVSIPTMGHFHAIRLTNSAAHLWGYMPYEAQFQRVCKATNCWWVALINGGEGWHNNHHAFMGSAKHGFMWWEFDWVYVGLRMLGQLGVVWDIKVPTDDVLAARYSTLPKHRLNIRRLYRLECPAADLKKGKADVRAL
eukprot:CAMPEP_0180404304 /NCGR_PEP_ID=MMETSP0989-20121125/39920_1 /TAXON_ID=697907 /ORGANISM="non described non described, Strain CCMP2293" /LENGTH=323 /DNA_ID=CAMNT_0022407663 /DNA_START=122 /DNA_END=1093 /DNA_ORIENTATION=-